MTYPNNTILITLDHPYTTLAGVEISEVTMRSPTVRDRVLRAKDRRADVDADIQMIATMCNMTYDDLLNMEGSDYLQIEHQFNVFLQPVAKLQNATS